MKNKAKMKENQEKLEKIKLQKTKLIHSNTKLN